MISELSFRSFSRELNSLKLFNVRLYYVVVVTYLDNHHIVLRPSNMDMGDASSINCI